MDTVTNKSEKNTKVKLCFLVYSLFFLFVAITYFFKFFDFSFEFTIFRILLNPFSIEEVYGDIILPVIFIFIYILFQSFLYIVVLNAYTKISQKHEVVIFSVKRSQIAEALSAEAISIFITFILAIIVDALLTKVFPDVDYSLEGGLKNCFLIIRNIVCIFCLYIFRKYGLSIRTLIEKARTAVYYKRFIRLISVWVIFSILYSMAMAYLGNEVERFLSRQFSINNINFLTILDYIGNFHYPIWYYLMYWVPESLLYLLMLQGVAHVFDKGIKISKYRNKEETL